MRNFSILIVALLLITGCANSQTNEKSETEQTTAQNIDFENAYFVDVRTPQEFASGHYDGAINIPLNTIENYIEEIKGHEQVVVYCRSGGRSAQAKKVLDNAKVENVINGINQDNLESLKTK
ncbi:rhodanese-like domain-containing protein [Brumimicrobium aurantiacum]|uniref:Rhodanese-like domain-containing protein n=1 Tax=Brumimicrobium aurantiacum TaxID=1737063 RepID=A0A3E1EYL7_9FLAO|nr:rhodanese-like domain-containing protein [Brumimicrobium aurantiacum]RFC54573.1 rhodanese-like domain-containing protein [Brumimicrobium aurantiacum]